MAIDRPLMRYHGGKFRLAPWIMSFFPEHKTYVEPFGGGAGVLLQKKRAYAEVYNDLDSEVVNVFRVLQSPDRSSELKAKLALTPYSREEFALAQTGTNDPVEKARRTLIRAYMGFGSAGASKARTGFRIDSGRNYATAFHIWSGFHEHLGMFIDRFKGVLIENRAATTVIENHDRDDTLFFVDPPYLHSTRVIGSNQYYRHEMTDDEHVVLLEQLKSLKGLAVVSGYESDLYNDHLRGWTKHKTSSRIAASRGAGIRTEVVWLNPQCADRQFQKALFT